MTPMSTAIRMLALTLASFLLVLSSSVYAVARALITAKSDASVFEADPDRKTSTSSLLTAGIGRGHREGMLISYMRFDLSALPDSTLLENVAIETAELRLFAQSFGLAANEARFFVTISACDENDWSENMMTWNSRPCQKTLNGEDSTVIAGALLPAVYTWDVTRAIAKAHAMGKRDITFAIQAFLLRHVDREIVPGQDRGPAEAVGFVRFWSRERLDFGLAATPTLSVGHSSSSTKLLTFLGSIAAILSALGVVVGLYEAIVRLRKPRADLTVSHHMN